MAHTHSHEDAENYFLDQIFTIALCGALGVIAVLLYVRAQGAERSMLRLILDPRFHPYVLAGGIALLVLVAIRAIAVWKLAGQSAATVAHAHTHSHDHHHHHEHDHHHEPCNHAHDHCDHEHEHEHSHDHGHEHGWSPWRYTVLMLPVVLYFLNLPSEGFSARVKRQDFEDPMPKQVATVTGLLAAPAGPAQLLTTAVLLPEEGGVVTYVDLPDLAFSRLERAAFSPEQREQLKGKSTWMIGKFAATGDPNQFGLVRYKMNCCAADALPLNAVIMVNPDWPAKEAQLDVRARQQKWVKITGRIYFFKMRGRADEFVPAIVLFPDKDHPPNSLVEIVDQPADPYAR